MDTRHKVPYLAIALSIGLLLPLCPSFAEETGLLPFLKIGRIYQIKSLDTTARSTVKILEPAGGQWVRVEYYTSQPQPDGKDAQEAWINFANVVSVREFKEPAKTEPEKKEPRLIKPSN
jgi:hypothetical protein